MLIVWVWQICTTDQQCAVAPPVQLGGRSKFSPMRLIREGVWHLVLFGLLVPLKVIFVVLDCPRVRPCTRLTADLCLPNRVRPFSRQKRYPRLRTISRSVNR